MGISCPRSILNTTAQYLYVNFEPKPDEKKLTVNLHKSPRFAKHYYQWLISRYFNKVASVQSQISYTTMNFGFGIKKQAPVNFLFLTALL